MKKEKLTRRKFSMINVLFLGFIVLGIGCISWAFFTMLPPPDFSYTDSNSKKDFVSELNPSPDRSSTSKPSSSKVVYQRTLVEGDTVGSLSIPVLNRNLRIVEGTGEDSLKKGVGHFTESVFPGQKDNCILSGHRDTVFSKLNVLKIGDKLIVKTMTGTYTYIIKRIRIVGKDDRTVIMPTDHAVLTLTTCYPFHFFGNTQERYIVSADMVTNK